MRDARIANLCTIGIRLLGSLNAHNHHMLPQICIEQLLHQFGIVAIQLTGMWALSENFKDYGGKLN